MWYLRNGRTVFDRAERASPEGHRIYRPSTSRPPVVSSTVSSAVSSTTSVAGSECGSTTLLLPSRPQPRQQPRAHPPAARTASGPPGVATAAAAQPRQHRAACRHHPDKQYLRDLRDGDLRERNLLLAQALTPTLGLAHKKEYQEVPDDDHSDDSAAEESGVRQRPDLCPQVMAALSVSLGSMVVGFASGYTSPALEGMREDLAFSKELSSWVGSIMPLGALAGGILGGPLIEGLGRRTTILATAVPFIISWFLIALAMNITMVLAGRAIAGVCVGIASLSLPVYLGETVQPEVRGTLGLMPTTLGNIGILLCFLCGKYLDWSNLAMLGGVIPVPFLICMFLIPETPRWYMSKGKAKQARAALQWLRGSKADVSFEMSEIERIAAEAEKNASESSRFGELFSRANARPLLITIGLMLFQQMSGINAVIFYAASIFKSAGSTIEENLCTIIIGVVNFFSTFVATVLIDRLGRKVLLYASSVTMTLTLGTLGAFFYARDAGTEWPGWIPLACLMLYVVGFSVGFGPVPWLMMGEILPANIRGSAASLATAFNWSCVFLVTLTFENIMTSIGKHNGYWMFAGVCFVGLFFVIFFVPETQGKSLEDIEKKLTGQRIRRMSSVANLRPMPMAV
ncbi:facilitated trehalose transporter Tret1 isoform X2 [Frankliniella occidentalis]|uniref:Facilitated trehalose transporter Tret1 isoform X2 n=1 Tax=Frankliniella occidentalis TaxID=133901 RepID=A0A6J1SVJ1_FRAOC|nr:facilitated trehalose transporter Tret1 isoform X2 [Frankliniella occidentalis]